MEGKNVKGSNKANGSVTLKMRARVRVHVCVRVCVCACVCERAMETRLILLIQDEHLAWASPMLQP